MRLSFHEDWCDFHADGYPFECNCGETGARNPPAILTRKSEPAPAEKQSRADSFCESATNIAIGLAVSQLANLIIIPLVMGVPISAGQNLALAVFYTIVSLLRGYAIRRAFNGRSVWASMKALFA